MGLTCSHNAWQGSYGSFGAWRNALADAIYIAENHFVWLNYPYLLELLNHSDCEGSIAAAHCAPLADELIKLLPYLTFNAYDDYRARTVRFIAGLRAAASAHEPLEFA